MVVVIFVVGVKVLTTIGSQTCVCVAGCGAAFSFILWLVNIGEQNIYITEQLFLKLTQLQVFNSPAEDEEVLTSFI